MSQMWEEGELNWKGLVQSPMSTFDDRFLIWKGKLDVFIGSKYLLELNYYKVYNKALSDHLESLSTSVPEILTACSLNDQCSGLYA